METSYYSVPLDQMASSSIPQPSWRYYTRQDIFNIVVYHLGGLDLPISSSHDNISPYDNEFYTNLLDIKFSKNKLFIFALCNNLEYNTLLYYSSVYEKCVYKIIGWLLK